MTAAQLISIVVTYASLLSIGMLISFTRFGRALRAMVQDRETAMLMGVDIIRLSRNAYLLAMSLGIVGGMIFTLVSSFSPDLRPILPASCLSPSWWRRRQHFRIGVDRAGLRHDSGGGTVVHAAVSHRSFDLQRVVPSPSGETGRAFLPLTSARRAARSLWRAPATGRCCDAVVAIRPRDSKCMKSACRQSGLETLHGHG